MIVLEPEVVEVEAILDPVGRILEGAAEVVKKGWIKGHFYRNGGHCVVGAITVAAGGEFAWGVPASLQPPTFDQETATLAQSRVAEFLGLEAACKLSQWNDRVCRNADEVITALQCAARWRE